MRKSNWIYVLYQTFNSDLLFWIVIDNLFLSTVKGMDAFNIVLITLSGLACSLFLYPLTNQIVKRTSNKFSIIMGSLCFMIAIFCFMISQNLLGFIIGQTFYGLSTPFKMVANIMLKNNLAEKDQEEDFIKWQSYGRLGYSTITLLVSIFAGLLFNVNPYLPIILSLCGTIIALILSLIYKDSNNKGETSDKKYTSIFKQKPMVLILLLNIFAIGTYIFLQTKSTLLIQYVLEDAHINLVNISIIISAIVFGSRICRVISDIIFPRIYKKTNHKSNILIILSILLLLSNSLIAMGANIPTNYIIKIILITLGFYMILLIRDMYEVTENKIVTLSISQEEQKHAFLLIGFYEKLGKLISHGFGLIILGFLPLNTLYIFMISFSTIQVFICIPLSKYLKNA